MRRAATMLLDVVLLLAGLGVLYVGAEWLVRGAARLARALGMSALVVGLTVVAFGTSSPELVASGLAAWRGQTDVAVGNVIGSNLINIALILGLASLFTPMRVERSLTRREIPLMIGAAFLMVVMALDGEYGRVDAAILLSGFVAYLVLVLRLSRRSAPESASAAIPPTPGIPAPPPGRPLRDAVLVAAGVAGLAVGAHLMVTSAVSIGRAIGISELVIGLTIVAVGTSLPELATAIAAALRRSADIGLGNIVGSNVFNTLGILGVAVMIRPAAVDPRLLRFELPAMLLVSVAVLPLAYTRGRLSRWEGGALVIGYVVFTWLLLGSELGAPGR